MGVSTIVVHDVASVDGEVVEDTYDWFAQDSAGNVWYFGEDTTAYDDAGTASHEGAWEAGVGGALPGVVMAGEPAVTGTGYRQEFLPGVAEDMGEIIAVSGSASTPFGDFDDVIVTRDWTPSSPKSSRRRRTHVASASSPRRRTTARPSCSSTSPPGPDPAPATESGVGTFTPPRCGQTSLAQPSVLPSQRAENSTSIARRSRPGSTPVMSTKPSALSARQPALPVSFQCGLARTATWSVPGASTRITRSSTPYSRSVPGPATIGCGSTTSYTVQSVSL